MTSGAPSGDPKTDRQRLREAKREQRRLRKEKTGELSGTEGSELNEDLFTFAKKNTRDTVAYIFLIVGILLMFFESFYGGLIIGIVLGLYFTNEIYSLIKNYRNFFDEEGIVRSLILGGTVLAFFIAAPSIFIGAAIAVAVKIIIFGEEKAKTLETTEKEDRDQEEPPTIK